MVVEGIGGSWQQSMMRGRHSSGSTCGMESYDSSLGGVTVPSVANTDVHHGHLYTHHPASTTPSTYDSSLVAAVTLLSQPPPVKMNSPKGLQASTTSLNRHS